MDAVERAAKIHGPGAGGLSGPPAMKVGRSGRRFNISAGSRSPATRPCARWSSSPSIRSLRARRRRRRARPGSPPRRDRGGRLPVSITMVPGSAARHRRPPGEANFGIDLGAARAGGLRRPRAAGHSHTLAPRQRRCPLGDVPGGPTRPARRTRGRAPSCPPVNRNSMKPPPRLALPPGAAASAPRDGGFGIVVACAEAMARGGEDEKQRKERDVAWRHRRSKSYDDRRDGAQSLGIGERCSELAHAIRQISGKIPVGFLIRFSDTGQGEYQVNRHGFR